MSRRTSASRHGAAAVELALTMPIILALLLGVWEVGRIAEVENILNSAASEGARQASTGTNSAAQVQTIVTNYLKWAGMPTQNVSVTVNDVTNPSYGIDSATELDSLQITVTIPFKDVRWTGATLVTSNSTNLTATATWYAATNKAYPANPSAPQGW
jgi:Flp pilus assembly protein TadG